MNKKFILGLGSVVLLASSLVAGDAHYDRGSHARDYKETRKHIKRDHGRGNYYSSYENRYHAKKRHHAHKKHHMKKRARREARRIVRRDFYDLPHQHSSFHHGRVNRAIFLDLLSHNTRFYVSF